MAFLDETGLAEVWSLANNKFLHVAMGGYNGTVKYGSSNPNTLTFNFAPKLVFIYSDSASSADGSYGNSGSNEFMIFTRYRALRGSDATNTLGYSVYVKFDGNTVTWYSSTSAACQGNNATGPSSSLTPVHYRYLAIG